MIVRQATAADHPVWAATLAKLHSEQSAAEFEKELAVVTALPEPYVAFLAFTDDGQAIGMMDATVRNYAEGAPNLRAAYVEDLWIEPKYRRLGAGKQLLRAVEGWARAQGLDWLGSDALIDNELSHSWHLASGFEEIERLVIFGKPLH